MQTDQSGRNIGQIRFGCYVAFTVRLWQQNGCLHEEAAGFPHESGCNFIINFTHFHFTTSTTKP